MQASSKVCVMSTFLVSGGTGRIGTAFVHEIAARGHSVRLGTRNPEGAGAQLRARFGPGEVQPVVLDPSDADGLARAFDGVTGALLVAPFQEIVQWHAAMGAAAHKAGVAHIVKVSVIGARPADTDPPPGRLPSLHYQGEQALRDSGVGTTMIRPTIFSQHFLGLSPALFRPGDPSVHLPIGDAAVAFLDCRDIAACAAALLCDPSHREAHNGKAFELTGPSAVTGQDIAAILSGVGERPIAWVDGADAFSTHAQEIGVSDGIKGIYAEAAGGWFSSVADSEFTQITGRHPTSFAKFAYDHRDRFTAR